MFFSENDWFKGYPEEGGDESKDSDGKNGKKRAGLSSYVQLLRKLNYFLSSLYTQFLVRSPL
jgi:hypothetical protein